MKKKEAEKKKKDFLAAKAPAVVTRITSLFGCRYPLILPGMSWISRPELVAAVSNAGERFLLSPTICICIVCL